MDKSVIQDNFSRNACSYDNHSSVQAGCAERLSALVSDLAPGGDILEIGCGTGIFTSKLAGLYRDARITAMDISEEMVNIARRKVPGGNIRFVTTDGGKISAEEKFDLIVSNAVFTSSSGTQKIICASLSLAFNMGSNMLKSIFVIIGSNISECTMFGFSKQATTFNLSQISSANIFVGCVK